MKQFNFSFADVLAELTKRDSNGEGFTTSDMVEATGHGDAWCRKKIKYGISIGILKPNGDISRPRIDGRMAMVPSYVVVKNE